MESRHENIGFDCPSEEIASYIDGEMESARESELEAHFAACSRCTGELNQQRMFLCSLNASLKNESELDLPTDFTKRIVANAESTVSGLRRPRERFNALFICAGLFLFALFALGTGAGNFVESISTIFGQIAAVGGFLANLIYSVFLGLAIVLRALASQLRIDIAIAVELTMLFALLLTVISRKVLRANRV